MYSQAIKKNNMCVYIHTHKCMYAQQRKKKTTCIPYQCNSWDKTGFRTALSLEICVCVYVYMSVCMHVSVCDTRMYVCMYV